MIEDAMHRPTLNLGVVRLLQFTPQRRTRATLTTDDGTTACESPTNLVLNMRLGLPRRVGAATCTNFAPTHSVHIDGEEAYRRMLQNVDFNQADGSITKQRGVSTVI